MNQHNTYEQLVAKTRQGLAGSDSDDAWRQRIADLIEHEFPRNSAAAGGVDRHVEIARLLSGPLGRPPEALAVSGYTLG